MLGILYLAAYLYAFLRYIFRANSYQFNMILFSLLFMSIIYRFLRKNLDNEIFKTILHNDNDIEFQNKSLEFKKRYKLDFYILINLEALLIFSVFMSVTSAFLYKLYWLENI